MQEPISYASKPWLKHYDEGVPAITEYPAGTEIIKAFIVLKPGFGATLELAEELKEHCRTKLAPYKVPYEIEFREELPLTPIGKPLKRALQEETRRGGAQP